MYDLRSFEKHIVRTLNIMFTTTKLGISNLNIQECISQFNINLGPTKLIDSEKKTGLC